MTLTTGRPATSPENVTTPAAAVRTSAPAPAARSTPRCPAAHGFTGGSNRPSTPPPPPTGQARAAAPAAVPDAVPAAARAAASAGPGAAGATSGPASASTTARTSTVTPRAAMPGGWPHPGRRTTRFRNPVDKPPTRPHRVPPTGVRVPPSGVETACASPPGGIPPADRSAPARPLGPRKPRPSRASAGRGVARPSALPVHFTRDPVRRVDFARPATGGRTWTDMVRPQPPPGASAARSAEPDRSPDREGGSGSARSGRQAWLSS